MANSKKENETRKKQPKPMSRKEKFILITVCVILVIAIAIVSIFVLYPKLAGKPDWQIKGTLSFKDDSWIEDMVNNRIKPTERVIDVSSSFVYTEYNAFITHIYASTTSVEDAKAYYLQQIPGSVDYDEGEVSNLNISGTLQGEKIDVLNYEAEMLNAYDIKVTIDSEMADFIKAKLIRELPVDLLNSFPELAFIRANEKLGGYIMYKDDELSSNSYPGTPIFSEAFRYSGSKAELTAIQVALNEKYQKSRYFEDAQTVYFKDGDHIFSLSISESDLNILAVITVQKIPDYAVN